MADVRISAFVVVARSRWNDNEAAKVGYKVLEALYSKWHENQGKEPLDDGIKGLLEPNTSYNTTITVNIN